MNIAFSGTGYISKIHAQAARNLGAQLVAVVNHRSESMAQFAQQFGIARQHADVGEMLRAGGVDVLVVATPNYLHAPEAIAALRAGVHVLVEKPMALNAAEARAMLDASTNAPALLLVAHCWRFDPEVLWLRARAQAGELGQIIRTKGYGVHANWGPTGWFTEARFAGGGALADMGIHAIDTVRFLLGDPQPASVYARIGTHYKNYDVDDTGVIIVNWAGGVSSYIESGWWQPHCDGREAATQLYGTRGIGSIFPTHTTSTNATGAPTVHPSGFAHPRADHSPQSLYDAQLGYFFDCIRQQRRPVPGAAEGLCNMRIVDAAYESARSSEVVHL